MKQKIAILADIHGNMGATEAVLADAKAQQATDYWFIGDLFLPGPGRSDLLALLRSVKPSLWLRGNWERVIYTVAAGRFNPQAPDHVYFARLTQFLLEDLSSADFAWMKALPIAATTTVNGVKIGLSHNQPFRDEGRDLYPAEAEANFDQLFAPDQDIAIYGHTHQQVMRVSDAGQLVINPGATGQPYSPWQHFFDDQRAHYALLEIDDAGRVQVDFRKVEYDIEAEIAQAKAIKVPYFDLYAHLRRTGKTSTHDNPALQAISDREGYVADVRKFFQV
ncbi:metallophosphoesterase family protein [Lacticaseibacillus brantae]|uniref:Calcineurin-like phosphoesterase domain-containing protein n=1 Tax=Lacticaseibacillus brantae DSM 23927 TaxID=1423727 RepID=A0A0R2B5C8_9LACO|nr:metallophosphoesterase family protein [Lacticaseibacillus brantae]KRM71449.1 hypothetical protein FC34_GL001561 [Lacticaseibacillus brantae DSM 23927]